MAHPSTFSVGHDVIPNKIVWFRSLSPRIPKITIRYSSPPRPTFKPQQIMINNCKKTPVQKLITNESKATKFSGTLQHFP
jgi:hypothetical protein